ncbi:hypothetical protein [Streptomyces sp. NPDC059371]|uniref:hypothetical protein n=1 Tax=Streptomyces sp. NPDC059371 TaxID=3346812 RepID=UPI00367DCA8D
MPQRPEPVGQPEYLTEKQWIDLAFAVMRGVVEGCRTAELGLDPALLSDLGTAAVNGLRARLDQVMAESQDR